MDKLIGAKTKALFIDKAKERLVFQTDKGDFAFVAEGDCCSQSWFEHLSGVEDLINSKIKSVRHVDMGEIAHPSHECLQLYGTRIQTARGVFEIEMRNSSNGYYGGYISQSSNTSLDGMDPATNI